MKTAISLITLCLLMLCACEKDDFNGQFTAAPKLLVSINENGHLISAFKYDNLNRLVQSDKYYAGDTIYLSEYYDYNSKNQLISKRYGEYVENYEYNRNGSLKSKFLHFKSANDGYEWEQITQFQYSHGRIYKGTKFTSDGHEISHYSYKYDQNGNTTERTEYTGNNDMLMSQYKFTYDDKINPGISAKSIFWGENNLDIFQGNNPTSTYYYNAIMSSFPPQFEMTYDYDNFGLPIKEFRKQLNYPIGESVFEYTYIEKAK